MNHPYLELDETGTYVEGTGFAPRLPDNAIAPPTPGLPSRYEGHYFVDGALVPRPKAPVPVALPGGGYRLGLYLGLWPVPEVEG